MKPEFVLGIDGGGAQTGGRIERLSTGESWEYRGGPSSLTNNFESAIHEIRRVLSVLLKSAYASPPDVIVVIGVAGAGNEALRQQLAEFLALPFFHLCITTDARIALYGSRGGEPVVTLTLGTGSVAMRLESDGTEVLVGGWGFNIGDEGGGAALGKQAIKAALRELDLYRECRSETARFVADTIGTRRTDILNWLKQASAYEFADLVPRLISLAQRCTVAQSIWRAHATEVASLIQLARCDSGLPVMLLGWLAPYTLPLLPDELKVCVTLPQGDALDGALLLAHRHWQSTKLLQETETVNNAWR